MTPAERVRILSRVTYQDGVTTVYQPVVDTARGVAVGCEGLARYDLSAEVGIEERLAAAWMLGSSAEIEIGIWGLYFLTGRRFRLTVS